MRRHGQIYNSNGRIQEYFSETEKSRKQKISNGKITIVPRNEVKSLGSYC